MSQKNSRRSQELTDAEARKKRRQRKRRRAIRKAIGTILFLAICLAAVLIIPRFLNRQKATAPEAAPTVISAEGNESTAPAESYETEASAESSAETAAVTAVPVQTEHDYSTVPYPYSEEKLTIPTPTYEELLPASKHISLKKKFGDEFIISHALGGIDELRYSNSLEAFKENYKEGHRIFEADFCYTADFRIVLWHDWGTSFSSKYPENYNPTYDEFMSSKVFDKYTPMSLESLLELMDQYPDMYLVTDTKFFGTRSAANEFTTIIQTAIDMNLTHVLDRMIVQVYTEEMYEAVNQLHQFPAYIFTTYHRFDEQPTNKQFKNLVSWCKENKIELIAVKRSWFEKKFVTYAHNKGILYAMYTVNTDKSVNKYKPTGVDVFYSDFLTPKGKEPKKS